MEAKIITRGKNDNILFFVQVMIFIEQVEWIETKHRMQQSVVTIVIVCTLTCFVRITCVQLVPINMLTCCSVSFTHALSFSTFVFGITVLNQC